MMGAPPPPSGSRASRQAPTGFDPSRCVMVCYVCDGEGEIADGLDEAACSMPCPRCDGNCWLVDLAGLGGAALQWLHRLGDEISRGNPNIIQCPLDPETSRAEYIAWHEGFLRGVEQANAIWSRTCKAVAQGEAS